MPQRPERAGGKGESLSLVPQIHTLARLWNDFRPTGCYVLLPASGIALAESVICDQGSSTVADNAILYPQSIEQLRCKTPAMVEKELLAFMIAHNLLRCVMAEAAILHGVPLDRLSFKGSLDALRQFCIAIPQGRNRKTRQRLWADRLKTLARDLVPRRPGRREPRAVKRRPKPYPLLTKPRRRYREILHRCRYRKDKRRNLRPLN